MKKIIVFGKTGFIGKNLAEELEKDYKVVAPSHAEIDLCDESALKAFLAKEAPEIVINATDLRASGENYFETRMRMFDNLAKYSGYCGKIIFFGSGAEYDRQLSIKNITEDEFDRVIPTDSYGYCLYKMTEKANRSNNIYNLRLFGIFGKYELWDKRFISNSICKALCGYPITIRQDKLFDYLCIDDLLKIVLWMSENTPKHHDYNAVSGRSISLSAIADMVKRELNSDVPVLIASPGMGQEYTASNARLVEEYKGFTAEPMEASLVGLVQFYRQIMDTISREKLLYN